MPMTINRLVKCNIDLRLFGNKRLNIIQTTQEPDINNLHEYQITSNFKVPNCFNRTWVMDYIRKVLKRKNIKLRYITGNCSQPSGYIFF